MGTSKDILNKEIKVLGASSEFSYMARKNGFLTLGDILRHPVPRLMEMPLMNYRMLTELCIILQGHSLLGLLKDFEG